MVRTTVNPLPKLGITLPIIAAPMAGGTSTVEMVLAATRCGALGFLAAGYKSPEAIYSEITSVRAAQPPNTVFGVNVFVPTRVPVDIAQYRSYAVAMQREADQFGITLPTEPIDDEDSFTAKIDMLLTNPVPVVSFTFGMPHPSTVRTLRSTGMTVVQTVTSIDEALAAKDAGADVLAVQSGYAGGHSGTWTPERLNPPVPVTDLVAAVANRLDLPIVAAGGIGTADDVTAAVHAGAQAVMVGTTLLRADESGASATHRAALADSTRTETVMTRAFTGRPARSLRNTFIDTYESQAPLGYPAIHHLTGPLRKAAAAAGQPDLVHLWAGTGFRHAAELPAADILHHLASRL